jgi:small-conductance mechanosensitive channel
MNHFYSNFVSIIRSTLLSATQRIVEFLPNLLSAFLILLIGWGVAALISRLVRRVFRTLRLDTLAEKRGLSNTLRDIGIDIPLSVIASTFTFWLILLLTLEPLAEALHLTYISHLVAKVLSYIPTALAAVVILLVGLSFARLISASVTRSARSANLEYAVALGIVTRYFLSLIVIIITLAQIGVQTAILTIIFAVILLSVGIASALAFGVGSRAVVANILAGAFVRDHFPEGRDIEVQGIRGKVVAVNSVGTTVVNEGRVVTVPNSVLMENIVE